MKLILSVITTLSLSTAAFADQVADVAAQEINAAFARADQGLSDAEIVGDEMVGAERCYQLSFMDNGIVRNLLVDKTTYLPCEETNNSMMRYIPPFNPGVWAAVYSTIINSNRPSTSRPSNRPSSSRPCRRCRR